MNNVTGTVELHAQNVSSWAVNEIRESEPVFIAGLTWKLHAIRQSTHCLDVRLNAVSGKSEHQRFSAIVKVTYQLLRQSNHTVGRFENCKQNITLQCVEAKNLQAPWTTVVSWRKLNDPFRGWLLLDTILLNTTFAVQQLSIENSDANDQKGPTSPLSISDTNNASESRKLVIRQQLGSFDSKDSVGCLTDVAILVEGRKVYVSKTFLAIYSPVFRAMLFGDFPEGQQDEVNISETTYDEFVELLHVIYPSRKPVDDANVESLLRLGDRYDIQCVLAECEMHLYNSSKIDDVKKFVLADKYRLENLMTRCRDQFTTTVEIKRLMTSPSYRDLSESTRIALLEKGFEMLL